MCIGYMQTLHNFMWWTWAFKDFDFQGVSWKQLSMNTERWLYIDLMKKALNLNMIHLTKNY